MLKKLLGLVVLLACLIAMPLYAGDQSKGDDSDSGGGEPETAMACRD